MGMDPRKLAGVDSIYFSADDFPRAAAAPTITVIGGEAGTVFLGIDSDANDAVLSKTEATDRTGITGVQAPALVSPRDSSVIYQEVSTLGVNGWLMNNNNDVITKLLVRPPLWVLGASYKMRVFWATASTTTTQVANWGVFGPAAKGDGDPLSGGVAAGKAANDYPSDTAYDILISPWTTAVSPPDFDSELRPMGKIEILRDVATTVSGDMYFLGLEVKFV